jgi:hypothetical protein
MRLLLDRSSPLYRAVYTQRTGAERINSRVIDYRITRNIPASILHAGLRPFRPCR